MDENLHDQLIIRYLSGEASAEEKKQLEYWLVEKEENQLYFAEMQQVFQAAKEVPFDLVDTSDTQADWAAIQSQLNEPKRAAIHTKSETTRFSMNLGKFLAAASIILLLGLGYFLYQMTNASSTTKPTQQLTYGTKVKETKTITLPDGSKVKLNHASYLSLKKGFNGKERRIEFEGEGFFEIAHHPDKPFIIETGKVRTNVLGTVFNLKAYTNDQYLRLFVKEGTVGFGNPWVHQVDTFSAGQAGVFDRTYAELKPAKLEAANALAWQSNTLIFNDTPIREALNSIERAYDVGFEGKAKLPAQSRITTTFEKASLEEVLETLAKTNQLKFDQTGSLIRVSK